MPLPPHRATVSALGLKYSGNQTVLLPLKKMFSATETGGSSALIRFVLLFCMSHSWYLEFSSEYTLLYIAHT